MGGIGSGWKRDGRRLTTEQVQRVDAITHGERVVLRSTPTGGERKLGACAGCARACRYLYQIDAKVLCERCHHLTRASRQQSHTAREELRRAPELLGQAIETANNFVEASAAGLPDMKEWSEAMRILSAGATQSAGPVAPADALTSAIIEAASVPNNPTLQERVIMADIAKTSKLLEKIESIIDGGEENYTDRTGVSSKKPMRVDSLSKLGSLWVALSQVRAARAGVVTAISEQRNGTGGNLEAAFKAVISGGHRDRDGYDMSELEAIAEGKVLPAAPERAPGDFAGRTFDAPAINNTAPTRPQS
jgi:hypothetical protein